MNFLLFCLFIQKALRKYTQKINDMKGRKCDVLKNMHTSYLSVNIHLLWLVIFYFFYYYYLADIFNI